MYSYGRKAGKNKPCIYCGISVFWFKDDKKGYTILLESDTSPLKRHDCQYKPKRESANKVVTDETGAPLLKTIVKSVSVVFCKYCGAQIYFDKTIGYGEKNKNNLLSRPKDVLTEEYHVCMSKEEKIQSKKEKAEKEDTI